MTLAELLAQLPATGLDDVAFPRHLLGAFRRKSITFCTGVTDETTQVYWFQSRSFTIDLRLPDDGGTPLTERQGWVGDTLWDGDLEQLSWSVTASYQPRNQWPEPASFRYIGNSILEFAPSGAYVEDWRQQAERGPIMGLRLMSVIESKGRREVPMAGGLILAGRHLAYAQSRLPDIDHRLLAVGDLESALATGAVSAHDIESHEVSVAIGSDTVALSTRTALIGQSILSGVFELQDDGSIILTRKDEEVERRFRFVLDLYVPDFTFGWRTACTPDALKWLDREARHLARHAVAAV